MLSQEAESDLQGYIDLLPFAINNLGSYPRVNIVNQPSCVLLHGFIRLATKYHTYYQFITEFPLSEF